MRIHNIIVAAGSGSRFGGPLPKQFMTLGELPVAIMAVNALRSALPDATDTIVLSESEVSQWHMMCTIYKYDSPAIAYGGPTRFDSVKNGLATVGDDVDIVLIHDGARPMPSTQMIRRLVWRLVDSDCHGVLPVLPVTDSIRQVRSDGSSVAVDRSTLRAVQTPQAFRCKLLKEAYATANFAENFTDDASVMEAAGYTDLALVEGNAENIKITNPADLAIAETLLEFNRDK